MRKLLKILSVLEIVIGCLCGFLAVAGLTVDGLISGGATLPVEQQAVAVIKLSSALGLISGIFNLACGLCGWKGAAAGDQRALSKAVKLGWIALIAALVSAALALVGDVTADRVVSAVCSSVVPVLFLVSAKSVKSQG